MTATLTDKLMRLGIILFCLLGLLLNTSTNAQKLAFPGAQGWAAYTPGGRGGKIIKVTNLNSEGPGSLKEALYNSNPRIVVFEISGTIDLNGKILNVENPFLTIAGQTAPSPGITIINGGILIATHDVTVQHLKIRPGATSQGLGWEPDGLTTYSASNIIIDHCSITWAVDENCSASGPRFDGNTPVEWRENTSHTITMSNNIIAEALSNATHSKGEHSKGTLIHDNVTKVALLNNLYSGNKDRNPLFKGGSSGVVVNNYLYNPGTSAIRYALSSLEWAGRKYEKGKITVINNVLRFGPSTAFTPLFTMGNGPCELFMHGNVAKNKIGVEMPHYIGDTMKLVDTMPIWHETINPVNVNDLLENIEQNVGARPWDRDNVDSRIIEEVSGGKGKIIDWESEVGGFPTFQPVSHSFNEKEWNLKYMVKISPHLNLIEPVNGESYSADSLIVVSLNTTNFESDISYIQLFVDGKALGNDSVAPYNWNFIQPNPGVHSLLAIAMGKNGMFYASDSIQITVYDETNSIKKIENKDVLELSVFPNPVRNTTKIQYSLINESIITIKILNFYGVEIDKVISGIQKRGTHIIQWDGSSLCAGTYLVQVQSNNNTGYKKIIKVD